MKKLFFWMLKKYSKSEKNRLDILSEIHSAVSNTYSEQTQYGNVYNANIEFLMSSRFICRLVHNEDEKSLEMIKKGISDSFDKATSFIKNEDINSCKQ